MENKPIQAPPREQQIIAPTHVTPMDFAKKKKVSRTVVYSHINNGKIIPDLVGLNKSRMIDWEYYKDYVFATPKWNAQAFIEKQKNEEDGS